MEFNINDYIIYIVIGIIIIFATCLAIANTAGTSFQHKYDKYSNMVANSAHTAGDFAFMLVQNSGYKNLKIAYTEKELDDAYSSRINTIILSKRTIESCSIAGFATVAHEFGHAVQHNSGNKKYKFLKTLKQISAITGNLSFPLMIAGAITFLFNNGIAITLLAIGAIIFAISLLTELVTIPIEYEASDIGLSKLKEYQILDDKEYKMAKKFLKSAGLTYVAAFLSRILAWTFLVPKYKH